MKNGLTSSVLTFVESVFAGDTLITFQKGDLEKVLNNSELDVVVTLSTLIQHLFNVCIVLRTHYKCVINLYYSQVVCELSLSSWVLVSRKCN